MPDREQIAPSRPVLEEAFRLAEEILLELEVGSIPLTSTALKACRVARLLNDIDVQMTLEYETGGYPFQSDGVVPEAFELARQVGRVTTTVDSKTNETNEVMWSTATIAELEAQMAITNAALAAAADPDSPPAPRPLELAPGNRFERGAIRTGHVNTAGQIAKTRAFIHKYITHTYYQLKFSGVASDVFSRIRERVDRQISKAVPIAVRKLTAAYDNLLSSNPEDWSNAVHSCRRVLQDLADALFPPTSDRTLPGTNKVVKLGPDSYINRLIAFVTDHSQSARFTEIVGSHLDYLGNRLDAVFHAAQKGSHAEVTREEADRYVLYTYMVVGDLLSLT